MERYADAVKVNYNTLQECRRVAGAYEKSKGVDNLTFYHHQVVAARDDRQEWLERAKTEGWSAREMSLQTHYHDDEQRRARQEEEMRAWRARATSSVIAEDDDEDDVEGQDALAPVDSKAPAVETPRTSAIAPGDLLIPDDDDGDDFADDDADEPGGDDEDDEQISVLEEAIDMLARLPWTPSYTVKRIKAEEHGWLDVAALERAERFLVTFRKKWARQGVMP